MQDGSHRVRTVHHQCLHHSLAEYMMTGVASLAHSQAHGSGTPEGRSGRTRPAHPRAGRPDVTS